MKSRIKNFRRSFVSGQSTLELTVAMIGALLFLFGSLKLFLWVNERLVQRHLAYEETRAEAGNNNPRAKYEPSKALSFFH